VPKIITAAILTLSSHIDSVNNICS